MNIITIKNNLTEHGYCIIPNVLTSTEVEYCKNLFYDWQKNIPNHDQIHKNVDPHGIYKYHQVGHTQHAWYIRTRPKIQKIFKKLWNTDELVASFDGCCYIAKNNTQKDNCWTHTDQAPKYKGVCCYQGLVALTDNKERTLVVYDGTHKHHEQYFKEKGIKSSKNWQLIDHDDVDSLSSKKRILNIPSGALVLWDSRTFHQNQFGKPNSEERIVQYVCYLPKNHKKNTISMTKKREKYFNERRTTSHWPYPIRVNSLQPQTYGDQSRVINYGVLQAPNLVDLDEEIKKII